MKQILVLLAIGMMIFSPFAIAQDETSTTDSSTNSQDTSSGDSAVSQQDSFTETPTETDEFDVEPGMTPDNPLYFFDDMFERPGDDPEKALDYKEEKIAEARVMIEEGKPQEAQQVLEKALEYNDILEREVSPEIKERIDKSSRQVVNVLNDLREQSSVEGWEMEDLFDDNIEQEGRIATAAELASKINELCVTLAKLDPLQYSDVCKSKDNSPKWMREKDKDLTKEQKEQAKIFVDKLSQCMENPRDCDCEGMGVQSFEDFCIEKSALAIECEEGNGEACRGLDEADPSDLLPDYLVDVFYDLQDKYSKSKFEKFMPKECEEAGATSPEKCRSIMFKLNAPQECIDAGLDGSSAEHEKECRSLMFKINSPKECLEAGINPSDPDAPRKCGKLMFQKNAPTQCLEAGLTGERRDDEAKCRQLMQGKGQFRERNTAQFNRDCNAIADANEKIKCYEQFYNNAQIGFNDDFMNREFATDQNTGEKITPEEEKARQECRAKGMGTILEYKNKQRIIICVNENEVNQRGQRCQSSQQIESLKQDCKNIGQDAKVENRGGCPWVICIGGEAQRTQQYQQSQQEFNVYGNFNPYVKEDRQEPYEPREPENRIDQQQPPLGEIVPGTASPTGPGTYEPPRESGTTPSEPANSPTPESAPSSEPSSTTPSEPAPTTGAAIFWDYYYQ